MGSDAIEIPAADWKAFLKNELVPWIHFMMVMMMMMMMMNCFCGMVDQ